MVSRETPTTLLNLCSNPSLIRNICILAHVDHGKTTLTDCLLSSNNIVSAKQAGRVRYMDSTEEEQARGITMKSSAIALLHEDEPYRELRVGGGGGERQRYLVNIIDSPGHVDFSMDVVTAARLCDGAIVVVDAVEGVCIQTHAVLRAAWQEGVRPVLLVNKLDRLICELRLSPLEAYNHISRIIEAANVIMSSLFTAEVMGVVGSDTPKPPGASGASGEGEEVELSSLAPPDASGVITMSTDAWALDMDETAERGIFFDPCKGNVVFSSAVDGWAFTVDDFAKLHAPRLALPVPLLRRALWGAWYYKPKAKKVVTGAAAAEAAKGKTMAVSMMLENIWAVYDALVLNPSEDRAGKIITALGLATKVPPRELAVKDAKTKLQSVMRGWLPLHAAVLGTVARALPSPKEAQGKRLEKLWPGGVGGALCRAASSASAPGAGASAGAGNHPSPPPLSPTMTQEERLASVRASVAACSTAEDAECVVFVSKMFAVPKASLPPLPPLEAGPHHPPGSLPPPSSLWGLQQGGASGGEGGGSPPDPFPSLIGEEAWGVEARERGGEGGAGGGEMSGETFVAFARVFSGVLRPNRPVFVLGPRYTPGEGAQHCSIARLPSLYLMMGRELLPMVGAFAGQVVGLGGLGGRILKTATLSSTPVCPSLTPMTFQTTPLVRVALSPVRTGDLAALEAGLALLNAADPCVETCITESGEMQLASLGELHLQRCITDLETRFAKCAINVSPPILQFQETVLAATAPNPQPEPSPPVTGGPAGGGGDGGGGGGEVPEQGSASTPPTSLVFQSSSVLSTPGPSFPVSWHHPSHTLGAGWDQQQQQQQQPLPSVAGITCLPGMAYLHAPSACIYTSTSDRTLTLRLRVHPLPKALTDLLSRAENAQAIKEVCGGEVAGSGGGAGAGVGGVGEPSTSSTATSTLSPSALTFVQAFHRICEAEGGPWGAWGCRVLTLGPKRYGPNLLIVAKGALPEAAEHHPSFTPLWGPPTPSTPSTPAPTSLTSAESGALLTGILPTLRSALVSGFNLSMSAGPLAGEPVRGVAVVVEEVVARCTSTSTSTSTSGGMQPSLSGGQAIQCMRDGVTLSLTASGTLRLVEAMYECELRCSGGLGGGGEALGKCYGVLSKRRARVLAEDLMEGSDTWTIKAHLPVAEIYGFADELRKKTSGAATSPQLLFSHWEVLDADPYVAPAAGEGEREEGVNIARVYVEAVRERKGLPVTKKLVVDAEKQRTRKK